MSVELVQLRTPCGDAADEALWSGAAGPAPALRHGASPLPSDAVRVVALRGGHPVARVGCGARADFSGYAGVTGYVGWYAAADDEAGVALLAHASERLLKGGARRVVGPLDGTTWYRYRAMVGDTVTGPDRPFLSEPVNPPEWPSHFLGAGYAPWHEYETRVVQAPTAVPTSADEHQAVAALAVKIRELRPGRFGDELRALHRLSLLAFAENPLYTPITLDAFEALYRPLESLLDPALVRMAEDSHGRLVGYVFAFPDLLAPPDLPRIVLKTLAVHPELRGRGLGAMLVEDISATAQARGAAVLHALMHRSNASRTISRRGHSELFRRYVLFGRGER